MRPLERPESPRPLDLTLFVLATSYRQSTLAVDNKRCKGSVRPKSGFADAKQVCHSRPRDAEVTADMRAGCIGVALGEQHKEQASI